MSPPKNPTDPIPNALRLASAFQGELENGAPASSIDSDRNPMGTGHWGNETLRVFGTDPFPPPLRSAPATSPLSEAHEKSLFAAVDPLYNARDPAPEPDRKESAAPWLYGDAELECWRLQVLRARKDAAALKVGYPGNFHAPSPTATFHLTLPPSEQLPDTLDLRAVGAVAVHLGKRVLYRGRATEELHHIACPKDLPAGVQEWRVVLSTAGEPPAILIDGGPLSTGLAPWQWSADGRPPFTPVTTFPQTRSGVPPHRQELQEIALQPLGRVEELFDFGCELLGHVSFYCPGEPALFVGESPAEARNSDPTHFEQSPALLSLGSGQWRSEHPLAFRYLRVTGGEPTDVACLAQFHPACYRGAFACSDERLTRIWMASAYTLRLCLHDFLIDGVKRDRLPWAGDLAMSLMANAHTFGDAEIVRRSLTVLGRAGIAETDINGIVDYSMWWIISQDHYQRYFADAGHLRRDWPRIQDTLARLTARCDADGLFATSSHDWLFIDWVDDEKASALQILWWWAQNSGANLAARMGDTASEALWRKNAAAVGKTLTSLAWDPLAGCWRARPDNVSGPSRHANILAVVSGLAGTAQHAAIRNVLLGQVAKPVGTPYMAGFESIALARLGAIDALLENVSSCWGGMLDRGATTFWEAFDAAQSGEEAYGFYGRPFAKSLCHAWSAGPAAFLISGILGLCPETDGWARWTLEPRLGPLQWACATVPTPHGPIEVSLSPERLELFLPAGTSAQSRGHTFHGPGRFTQRH